MIDEILTHAQREYPRECCGVVVVVKGRERYVPCRNVAADKTREFVISPEDYADAEDLGTVTKIVHSHPTSNPEPSMNDRVAIENNKLPWIIVNPLTEQWVQVAPSGYKAPLIGREYGYGVLDCYTLIKDYYAEHGVTLNDYERKGTLEDDAENYLNNLEKEGFVQVPTPEVGDMILMCLGCPEPNHAAIYLGNNKMLHHARGRLSSRDIFGGYWAKHLYGYFRHLDFKNKA